MAKKHIIILLIFLCLLIHTTQSQACGGPTAYSNIQIIFFPSAEFLEKSHYDIDDVEGSIKKEFYFLYPFYLDNPKKFAEPYYHAYCEDPTEQTCLKLDKNKFTPLPDYIKNFKKALSDSDFSQAKQLASSIISEMLDRPATLNAKWNKDFAEALEFLDLAEIFDTESQQKNLLIFYQNPYSMYLNLKPENFSWVNWPLWVWYSFFDQQSKPSEQDRIILREALFIRMLSRAKLSNYAKTHPYSARAASLRFIKLQEDFKNQIPNGWKETIIQKMTPENWQALSNAVDEWLDDYPQHPLKDLVQLMRLRLAYLQDDVTTSWEILLSMYPNHKPRIATEMRHVLKYLALDQDLFRKIVDLRNPRIDPLLFSAILPLNKSPLNETTWNRYWNISQKNKKAPWAINLQERLISNARLFAMDHEKLPIEFPREPTNPTELWGELRLAALLALRDIPEAKEQIQTLSPSPESKPWVSFAKTKLNLYEKNFSEPLLDPNLDQYSTMYLARVLYDENIIENFSDDIFQKLSPQLRLDIAITQAIGKMRSEKWEEGAKIIQKVSPEKAKFWHEAATLSKNKSLEGLLEWARFISDKGEYLFYVELEEDNQISSPHEQKIWYRSLNRRLSALSKNQFTNDPHLPWNEEMEKIAITNHLLHSSGKFLALKTYTEWMTQAGKSHPQAQQVLKEANATYRYLVDYDYYNSQFWSETLKNSKWAKIIRDFGRK